MGSPGKNFQRSFKMANFNQDFNQDSNVWPIWTEETAILRRADGKTQCQICGKEFTLLSSGKRHYKNTHEAISHECILCHKTLKNDSAYVLHLKKNHDVTKKQIEEAKVIKMQEQDYLLVISEKNVLCVTSAGCNSKFTLISSAKRHYAKQGPNHQRKKASSNPDDEQ